ncbi:MAG: DUF429 domain-containing protein [Ignavibacteria bacterium]
MRKSHKIVGVDLAGSPQRKTGICLLEGTRIKDSAVVYSDGDIMSFIDSSKPELVAIDAPLNLPPGRKSFEDRNGEHFRPCDRELLNRGIRFFPITLGPMRSLTLRGISLKKKLTRRKIKIIEIYPGAAQDIWGIPRKQYGINKLRRGLEILGIKGLRKKMNGDELDAVTGGVVGYLYLKGKADILGNFRQGAIVLPKISKNNAGNKH